MCSQTRNSCAKAFDKSLIVFVVLVAVMVVFVIVVLIVVVFSVIVVVVVVHAVE